MAEQKTTIYTKLLVFQKLGISIKKGETNPHFRNKYADINEILGKVTKPLNDLGIVVIQTPDEIGLITTLHDTESGTEITGRLNFVGATDPQKLGSNITYYRRYSLVAMLGLEDDDDDGERASAPAPKMTVEQAFVELRKAVNLDTLKQAFTSLPPAIQKDVEVIALKDELKAALTI